MSRQGQCGLTNPFVTSESSFGGYFLVGSDSVFLDCLCVHGGAVWADEIPWSPVKAVSGALSEFSSNQFSFTVFEYKGAVLVDGFIRHL